MKKVLLDTYCGAGGCSVGYARAGFHVVGVDAKPQPNYPYEFHQSDAIEFIHKHGHEFDVIHASPPCQKYSVAGKACQKVLGKEYPDLVDPTRQAILTVDRPYIIENVPGAPLRKDVVLYGHAFGLKVLRQRWFEIGNGIWLMNPIIPPSKLRVNKGELVTVAGQGSSLRRLTGGGVRSASIDLER